MSEQTMYSADVEYLDGKIETVNGILEYKTKDGTFYFAGTNFEMWIPMTSVKIVTVVEVDD